MTDSKEQEKARYEKRAKSNLDLNILDSKNRDEDYLKPPLDFYNKKISAMRGNLKVLELGAGMGENTRIILEKGFDLVATDISLSSLEVLKKRYANFSNLEIKESDIESLPFKEEMFDMVCSAGVLSYGDPDKIRMEIFRVLKKGGTYIALDSLNHNPIYKFNRYIHYLKKERSISTLERMPTLSTLDSYKNLFGTIDVVYFGSVVWAAPLFTKILGKKLFTSLSKRLDILFGVKKSAFKFVMVVKKLQ